MTAIPTWRLLWATAQLSPRLALKIAVRFAWIDFQCRFMPRRALLKALRSMRRYSRGPNS